MALAVAPVPLRRVCGLLASPQLARNALLLGANLGAGFCGYLLHAVLGRLLGPASYGTVAALIALSSVLLFPTQVIIAVVARYTATFTAGNHTAQVRDLIQRLTLILLPVGVLTAFGMAIVAAPLAAFLHIPSTQGIMILGLMFTVAFALPINIGALQGLERFSAFALFIALPVLLRSAFAMALALLGWSIGGVMLGLSVSVIVSYALSLWPVRDLYNGPRASSGPLAPVLSYSLTTTLALGGTILLYNLDTLLAKHFLDARQAGLYAALATVGKTVLPVSNCVTMVAFPRFAALCGRGERPTRAVLTAIAMVVALSLAVEAPFVLLPAVTMHLLVGPSFVGVAGQLGVYGLAMLLFAVAQVFVYYFLASGHRLFMLTILTCGAMQVALFALWHDSIGHLVLAVLVSKACLVLALVALFVAAATCSKKGVCP